MVARILVGAISIVALAVGVLAVPALPASAKDELTPAKLLLSWSIQGRDAPFILAKERGYYREVGIDLTINEGNGSLIAVQAVANGTADFASADVATATLFAGKGGPVKTVFVFQPKGGLAIAYHAGRKIEKMSDLKGVPVVRAANDNASQMFGALLAKHNMTWSDVKPTIVGRGAFETAFLSDKNSVLLGNYFSTFQAMKLKDPSLQFTLYSDLGLTVMTLGVIASEESLSKRPEFVRKFISASVRGFEEAIREPEAAVAAVKAHFPLVAKPEINRLQLLSSLDLLRKGDPIGWTSKQDWQEMVEVLRKYGGLDEGLPPEKFYTNEYLPKSR